MRLLVLAFIFIPVLALAHGGGLDSYGGHNNPKTGDYHCHREPCISNQAQVSEATDEAIAESREFVSLYNRKDWPHWIDSDYDCQNTRQELLIATSTSSVTFTKQKGCTVKAGQWYGVYTGQTFTLASDVDIDHVVPLAHAHRSGGYAWTRNQRRAFANDPLNLLAVDDSTNQAKSDKAPHEWMPPRKDYWCEYVDRWQRVKEKYGLSYTVAEHEKISGVVKYCE
jgi:hypothetical protein